jgi:hypothetical protein
VLIAPGGRVAMVGMGMGTNLLSNNTSDQADCTYSGYVVLR